MLFALFLCTITCFSQNISSSVLSSQGGSQIVNSMVIDWTLGEIFIETLSFNEKKLTQGFHQPIVSLANKSILADNPFFDIDIVVSPNPTTNIITAHVLSKDISIFKYILYDMTGKLLKIKNSLSDSSDVSIDVFDIPTGIYMLHVSEINGPTFKSFKIIKY